VRYPKVNGPKKNFPGESSSRRQTNSKTAHMGITGIGTMLYVFANRVSEQKGVRAWIRELRAWFSDFPKSPTTPPPFDVFEGGTFGSLACSVFGCPLAFLWENIDSRWAAHPHREKRPTNLASPLFSHRCRITLIQSCYMSSFQIAFDVRSARLILSPLFAFIHLVGHRTGDPASLSNSGGQSFLQ